MLHDQIEETMDMQVLEDKDVTDLNIETVHQYRNKHRAYKPEHIWNDLSDIEYLLMIGALGKDKIENSIRVGDTSVHKAIREVLSNCLINTDFYIPKGVVVKLEEDTLILEDSFFIRTRKHQIRLGGDLDPRNKALMKMFNLISVGERAGNGVPELFSVWKSKGWDGPIIEERFRYSYI